MGARGPTDFGDYQIAHMPPAAACAGAARWAAKYTLLRSVFCRTACQHAADKPAHRRAEHGSGSGDGTRRQFLVGLFAAWSQGDKGKSKDHGSLAAFLHPFAAVGKRVSRRSAKYPFLWRKNERAVGDAGPYGGSDESAPVFEGVPMRAVGDAVPYGRIRQGAAENAAQAISAHTADRPVHRLGREVIVCGDPWRQR